MTGAAPYSAHSAERADGAQPDGRTSGAVRITVVHSPACHFCDDAHRQLDDLSLEFSLQTMYLEAASAEGQRLVGVHRAPMFPLILVNGQFFSFGRLSTKKLRRHLEHLVAEG